MHLMLETPSTEFPFGQAEIICLQQVLSDVLQCYPKIVFLKRYLSDITPASIYCTHVENIPPTCTSTVANNLKPVMLEGDGGGGGVRGRCGVSSWYIARILPWQLIILAILPGN
jgi:hypothetical protein